MSAIRILGAAAAVALFAAPALAQPQDDQTSKEPSAYPEQSEQMSAQPAEHMGVPASGVVLLSSPTPPSEAWRLKAGDPTVVSNQPIADTRANRARYGQPLSNAGRRTAPVGN